MSVSDIRKFDDLTGGQWKAIGTKLGGIETVRALLRGTVTFSIEQKVAESALPKGVQLAKLILGDDFIGPEDIESALGVTYTEQQKQHAVETMPTDIETLQGIKADGMMLIFGPTKDLTLPDIRDLDNQLFYSKTGGWYSKDKEKFARTDKVIAGEWMIVRKSPATDSTSKNWDEQVAMIADDQCVPNVAEMTYAVVLYKKVRNVYLLGGVYVRTSSVDADGYHVVVGSLGGDGLDVNDYWLGGRHSVVGVAVARD